jgi:vacuolar-type H+-ATPase subunit H
LENQLFGLIEQLEDTIEQGKKMPFTAKVMIDEDQILEVLESIKSVIPHEIQQAAMVLTDRDRLIEDAREESMRLLSNAKKQADQMVNETEILLRAQEYADDLIKKAQSYSRDVKMSALKYSDELMRNLEIKLESTFKALRTSREELALLGQDDEEKSA